MSGGAIEVRAPMLPMIFIGHVGVTRGDRSEPPDLARWSASPHALTVEHTHRATGFGGSRHNALDWHDFHGAAIRLADNLPDGWLAQLANAEDRDPWSKLEPSYAEDVLAGWAPRLGPGALVRACFDIATLLRLGPIAQRHVRALHALLVECLGEFPELESAEEGIAVSKPLTHVPFAGWRALTRVDQGGPPLDLATWETDDEEIAALPRVWPGPTVGSVLADAPAGLRAYFFWAAS